MNAHSLYGLKVLIEPQRQRYTLPADVPPPPGMSREQFNDWSRRVCGFHAPILADGQVFKSPDGAMYMNATTWAALRATLADHRMAVRHADRP